MSQVFDPHLPQAINPDTGKQYQSWGEYDQRIRSRHGSFTNRPGYNQWGNKEESSKKPRTNGVTPYGHPPIVED